MAMHFFQNIKSSAIDANGRLLVFAAPLIAGFRGSPLALSGSKVSAKRWSAGRKNWAKRRAYGA
ncbi:MAG: hypothetical protein ACKVON_15455 [Beijerinckiaceae bacterium]